MPFGVRQHARGEERYASGINRSDGTNQGINRYETSHLPAATRLPEARKQSSRSYHGSQPHKTNRPPQRIAKPSRHEFKQEYSLAPQQYRNSRGIRDEKIPVVSRSSSSAQRCVTDPRAMHPKAEHIIRQFKKMLCKDLSDRRSLDQIMDHAYYRRRRISDFVRDKLNVDVRNSRSLEEIFNYMERKAEHFGPNYCVKATWERNSQVEDEEYKVEIHDPRDQRELITHRKTLMKLLT